MNDTCLMGRIKALEASARELQDSLLSRDTECIWSNLSKQEESLEALNRVQREAGDGLKEEVHNNPEIRHLLKRSLTVVQANRALTQRFLDVVGQTLSRLSGGEPPTYTGYGTAAVRRAPILVSQQG
ncbi:hypothetical protein [Pontiella agarivorans]|uniref:Flagellar protein FlgN n=1 Tax=Pontiella agarivorans TaxID=3038953 RepID=A0ABU5MT44_9BACT|nr:hypothetical protein [Pontiella agarivorans]MDZ8117302.1 hypothetical protein [Pontiella agarivorans]